MLVMATIVVQTIPLAGAAEVAKNEIIASEVSQEEYRTDFFDDSIFEEEKEVETPSYPVAEITEEREVYTKVFRKSDGSYTAAVYPQPVHFEQEGKLEEIDNTLELVTENGRSWYRNQHSSVQFSLPVHMSALAPIQVKAADGSEIPLSCELGREKEPLLPINRILTGA